MSREPGNSASVWDAATNSWRIDCREDGCVWSESGEGWPDERVVLKAYRAHWRECHKEES